MTKHNEHIALFIIGLATILVTFLLLLAFDKKPAQQTPEETATSAPAKTAAPVPALAPAPAAPTAEAEVATALLEAGAYLNRGAYEETKHIELLSRMKFLSGRQGLGSTERFALDRAIADLDHMAAVRKQVERSERSKPAAPTPKAASTPSAPAPAPAPKPAQTVAPAPAPAAPAPRVAPERKPASALSAEVEHALTRVRMYLSEGKYEKNLHSQMLVHLNMLLQNGGKLSGEEEELLMDAIEKMELFAVSQSGR